MNTSFKKKKSALLFPLFFLMAIVFCSSAKAQIIDEVPGEYWLDLRMVGINAKIKVPGDAKIIRENVGFIIGDGKSFCIQIELDKRNFSAVVASFEKSKTRKFIKCVKDDYYGCIAEKKVSGKKEYDFYLSVRLGRDYYLIKDSDKFSHPDISIVNQMYHCAETITAYPFF